MSSSRSTSRRRSLTSAAGLVFVALIASAEASGQGLFKELPAADAARLAPRLPAGKPWIQRSRLVAVDTAYFEGRVLEPGRDKRLPEAVVLNLFDDVSLTLVTERYEATAPGQSRWLGRIQDAKESRAVLIVKDGALTGNVRANGKLYQIRRADGARLIVEVDPAKLPDELPPTAPPQPESRSADQPAGLAATDTEDVMAGGGRIIDTLVVYTAAAAAAAPGIEDEIELAIEETNDTYERSGISQRLRLVHTASVAYTETGALETDRNRLRDTSDGFMDAVHALRDTHRADLVSLWVDNGDGCGIAFIMTSVSTDFAPNGFSVVVRDCAVGNYSFAHELGHNMSARHDWYVDPTNNSPYTYNHGYVNVADSWRTVMAYNNACTATGGSCTRLGYWSNPDNTYGGDPMGVPEGTTQAADNRKTLNNTAPTVARFRGLGSNEAGDLFGTAVASGDFDGDGFLDLAVGAPGESPFSDPRSGYVFVYKGSASGLSPWKGLDQGGLGDNEAGDLFGAALAAGDFDGDGKTDLAVGAPGEAPGTSPRSGFVFVFKGGASGLTPWKGLDQAGLGANEADDRFGFALAAGDFDGDGKADLAVGAPGEAPGTSPKSGYAFVFKGGASGPVAWRGLDQAGLGANEADDRFGFALTAGDFDGDGKADLAVGAPGEAPGSSPKSGYAFVFKGGASGPVAWRGLDQAGLGANEAGDLFGAALAAGDFDGDRRADLVVGAPGEAPGASPRSGYAFVFKGGAGGPVAWRGLDQAGLGSNEADDRFGFALAAGDFDADGRADLVVGAPGEAPGASPKSGYAFVFKGGAGGPVAWRGLDQAGLGSNESDDRFGSALACGDFSGDGKADLAVGAPGESPYSDPKSGYVFVFVGTTSGPTAWRGVDQEE